MKYWNGQIINPENFRVPTYNISPFSTDQLSQLENINNLEEENFVFETLYKKFGEYEFLLSGKLAIYKALSFYNLKKNDEVYIVTTTGNKYVSSCVTNEIEKYCLWSRELSDQTKLIFVIHEFGVIFKKMESLIKLNIPIIEDMAMSLFSTDTANRAGSYGDYTIYSLPKFFPLQYGGVLRYNKKINKSIIDNSQPFQEKLKKIIFYFLKKEIEIKLRRKQNYNYLRKMIINLGLKNRFKFISNETPSVFMFSSNEIDLDKLKVFLQQNGVECSVFYGENSFFLPVHQNLKQFDLDYIINLIKYFIYENK